MSNLATSLGDDFPEAAEKNLLDARCLARGTRWDGVAYHAGYVVECSLKTLLLVDALAHRAGSLSAVAAKAKGLIGGDSVVSERLKQLRSPSSFGHQIDRLRQASIGIPVLPGLAVIASGKMARYLSRALNARRPSRIFHGGSAGGWSETLRYQRAGVISGAEARRWCETAEAVYRQAVVRLRLDGVVTR